MNRLSILVDTNVVSYIFEGSELGRRYERLLRHYRGLGCPVTLAELHYGAYWRNWGVNRWCRLNEVLGRLEWLPLTAEVARLASHLAAKQKHGGRPVKWADIYIAATALINGLPIMTHDRDFADFEGLEVVTELPDFRISEEIADFYGRPIAPSRPLSTASWSN